MELLRVAHIPARRQAIFTDISKTPTLTTELWQELLIQLGHIRHTTVTRGGSLVASAAPTSSSARRAPDARTIPVRSADIFRPASKPPSTLQTALKTVLDGPIRAPPQPVLKVQQLGRMAQEEAGKKVEEVQQQVLGRIEAIPVGATVLSEAKGWNQALWSWVGREWARRSIQRSLPEIVLAQRIIEGKSFRYTARSSAI
jgi:nucleoporin NDC1